nr:MAG TPA: hypothetical protein [Microviridae sp.]
MLGNLNFARKGFYSDLLYILLVVGVAVGSV